MARRYLLSIDGGGIRGIIPATALVKLEQDTGKPAREVFQFVAGTSTGAILANGIAAGIPAQRMLDLYLRRGHEVFPQHWWNVLARIFRGSMYSTQRLREVLAEELGDCAGWALNDAPIDLLITAKRVVDGAPWYFVRDNPRNSQRTGHLPLVDCTTASAAAPTYFAPWKIPESLPPSGTTEPVGTLVDGGVGVAGNPVYQACVEAFYYAEGYLPEDTTVVSLGTGRFLARSHPEWIWPWLNWILGELLRSPGEQQTQIVRRHFPQVLFYRLDLELAEDIGMDDVGAIERLREYGERFAATIDWHAILEGGEQSFRVDDRHTQWRQYVKSV